MAKVDVRKIVNGLVLTNGHLTSAEVVAAAGITRQAVHRYLREMVNAGELVREGKGRAARYRPTRATFNAHLTRRGLAEDRVWDKARATFPRLSEFANASVVLNYAFTEMLNNAIDHSESLAIDVKLEVDVVADAARFSVTDAGVGVFENVRAKFGLDGHLAALQELSKGKVSTQPERHSGEGIFFTSKAARTFELEANGLLWIVDNARHDQAIAAPTTKPGTVVRFETSLSGAPRLEDVYAPYTHDFEFDTSRVVIKLFEHGVRFASRSEAKRLLAGLERFRYVILDFAGVEGVGQGFADEVFRVWARQHPETHLRAENMGSAVTFMVERARRAPSPQAPST